MIDWKNILISVLLSLIPVIAVAFLTVRLSLRQFYSQKWWEKKIETYSSIIGDLSNLLYCVGELFDEAWGIKEFNDNRNRALSKNYIKSIESLKKAVSLGAFIISEKVFKELNSLTLILDHYEDYNSQKEALSDYYAKKDTIIKEYFGKIRKLAKKDLKIK